MAFRTFILLPSADIHLVLEPVSQKSLNLHAIGYDDKAILSEIKSEERPGLRSELTFTITDNSIATVGSTGILTAQKEGITFLKVKYTIETDEVVNGVTNKKREDFELVARVWVHQKIIRILIADNSGSVNRLTDNFQPSLYAKFGGDDIEDITGHPYVTYESIPAGMFDIDPLTSRITGRTLGAGTLRIKDAFTRTLIGDLPIEVKDIIKQEKRIVEKVSFKGSGPTKRNILFLGEGFTKDEEIKFREIVKKVDHSMRTHPMHQPFGLLSSDYNTWMAFEPSADRGLTIGPYFGQQYGTIDHYTIDIKDYKGSATDYSLYELISLVGFPTARQKNVLDLATAKTEWSSSIAGFDQTKLSFDVFERWQEYILDGGRFRQKHSALGLMYGSRLGERYALSEPQKADNNWYINYINKRIGVRRDFRRMSSRLFEIGKFFSTNDPYELLNNWTDEFFDYFDSLKTKDFNSSNPNYHIGSKWAFEGDDQGLVVVIINCEIWNNHTKTFPNIYSVITLGNLKNRFTSAALINTSSGLVEHNPIIPALIFDISTSFVVHELCHNLHLGDEYEDIHGEQHANLPYDFSASAEGIKAELYFNVNTKYLIDHLGSKWNIAFFRVEKSSALSTEVVQILPDKIEFEIFHDEVKKKKWKKGDVVSLVTKNINVGANSVIGNLKFYQKNLRHDFARMNGLVIESIVKNKMTLKATLPSGIIFPKGSMMFQPKIIDGIEMTIILPGVLMFMRGGGPSLPGFNQPPIGTFLSSKRICDTNISMAPTPYPIANVNIKENNKHKLIGMHEGAATWNCGVVRATAECKMRSETAGNESIAFCHLCKYVIVHLFNPSKHSLLDTIYPGKPS